MTTDTKSLSKIVKVSGLICFLLACPISVVAAAELSNFGELVNVFLVLISRLIPVVFTLTFAVLVFLVIKDWVLVGSPDSIEHGKHRLLIGVIALAIMSGAWGLVALLKTSLFS